MFFYDLQSRIVAAEPPAFFHVPVFDLVLFSEVYFSDCPTQFGHLLPIARFQPGESSTLYFLMVVSASLQFGFV